ncbi:MAG: nucleotide exchange factor GrpE [Candidatus Saccharimonadales bacterium]
MDQPDTPQKDEAKKMKKKDKITDLEQQNGDLTLDLQRLRADFENYRKRTETEVSAARQTGGDAMIVKLLPVIDTLERAITHMPDDLVDNPWAKGVAGTAKKLEKLMSDLQLERISAQAGDEFNPDRHYAVQYDEGSEGEHEVITEELQAGYTRNGKMIRQAMVKVARADSLGDK